MSARESLKFRENPRRKTASQKFDHIMPNLELQGYTCEGCEDYKQSSSVHYHIALANQGKHNTDKHKTGHAPRLMLVYKV